jgi:hypothetical protein
LNWQSLRTLIAATMLTFVLGACTRTPEPQQADVDAKGQHAEDTRLCERYAHAAERVIARKHSEPFDFVHDADGPTTTGGNQAPRVGPPWTVRWSCTQRVLSLRMRLHHGVLLSALGNGAEIILEDLVFGIRRDGLDPKADKLSIVVELVATEEIATFDPRQPYVHYR